MTEDVEVCQVQLFCTNSSKYFSAATMIISNGSRLNKEKSGREKGIPKMTGLYAQE